MESIENQAVIERGFESKDKILVILVAVLGILFCEFSFGGLGISVPAYLTIFYLVAMWYFNKKGERLSKEGKLLFIPISLIAITFLLFSNPLLRLFNILLLAFLIIVQLGALNNIVKNRLFTIGTILDFFGLSVAIPLLNFTKIFQIINDNGKNKKSKVIFKIIVGLIIAVPMLLIVVALLMSADEFFQKTVENIINFLSKNIGEYILKVVLGLILAIPLFGFFFGVKHREKNSFWLLDTSKASYIQKVDNIIINTILIVLCSIYLLFIGIQFSYLFNGFFGKLPANFLPSQYAVRGFFEMEAIAIINYFILFVSYFIAKRNDGKIIKTTKTIFASITVLTVLLIATALSKMILYVNRFGLTLLRVYTTWFMILTIIFFAILLLKTFMKNISLVRCSILSFIVMYIILNFSCIDYIIPKFNIDRYLNDSSKKIDVLMFKDLSYEMMPQLARLLDDKNEVIKKDAGYVFMQKANKLKAQKNWQEFNISTYFAKKLADEKNIKMPENYIIDR